MATRIAVYGTQSGALRRIVVDSRDNANLSAHVGKDESSVSIADSSLATALAQVAKATGKAATLVKCAVIKNSVVDSVIMADPILDTVPNAQLVQVPDGVSACPGVTTYNGTSFVNPVVITG